MTTDLTDFLSPKPSGAKRGRPTNEERARRAEEADKPLPHFSEFRKPVGITFLASVVGKQPKQIAKRLEKCPVKEMAYHQGKPQPQYDFLTAIAYLIPPRGNIEDWFSQQNAASLPPYVNKMFWDSAHQRNRVMLESGDLWHTEDVMLVLARVSMAIRTKVNLWLEDLPQKELLTDQQYKALLSAKDELLQEVKQTLVDMPRETLSMTAHIKSELDQASGAMPTDEDRAFEEDESDD